MAPLGGTGGGRCGGGGNLLRGPRAAKGERPDGRGRARRVRGRRRTPERNPAGQIGGARRPDAGRRPPDRAPREERRESERRRPGHRVRRHRAPAPGDRPHGGTQADRSRARAAAGAGAHGRRGERDEPPAGAVRREPREARRRGEGLRRDDRPREGAPGAERCRAAPDRGRKAAGVGERGPGDRAGAPHAPARPREERPRADPAPHRKPPGVRAVGRHGEPDGERPVRADDGRRPGLPRGRPGRGRARRSSSCRTCRRCT